MFIKKTEKIHTKGWEKFFTKYYSRSTVAFRQDYVRYEITKIIILSKHVAGPRLIFVTKIFLMYLFVFIFPFSLYNISVRLNFMPYSIYIYIYIDTDTETHTHIYIYIYYCVCVCVNTYTQTKTRRKKVTNKIKTTLSNIHKKFKRHTLTHTQKKNNC